jgi:hypothetical protein
MKGPFICSGQPQTKQRAATVNDRASDRDAAPKASLTIASTVLLDIESLNDKAAAPALWVRGFHQALWKNAITSASSRLIANSAFVGNCIGR